MMKMCCSVFDISKAVNLTQISFGAYKGYSISALNLCHVQCCWFSFYFDFLMYLRASGTLPVFPLLLKCQLSRDRTQAFCFKIKRNILNINVKVLNMGKLVVIKMYFYF